MALISNIGKLIVDIPYVIFLLVKSLIPILIRFILPRKRKSLNGEIILITGAASGIGREVSCLISEKFKVTLILWDVNEAGLRQTAEECKANGATVHWYVVDLLNPSTIASTASVVRRDVGDITILFNNAGVLYAKPFLEEDPAREDATIRINLLSYIQMTREFLPGMIKRGKGHIVATSSGICFLRMRSLAAYSASKNGLKGFMDTIRLEMKLHPMKPDIRVATVYPAWVDTPLITDYHAVRPRYTFDFLTGMKPDAVAARIVDGIQLGDEEIMIPGIVQVLYWFERFVPSQFMIDLEERICPNLHLLGKKQP